MGRLIDADALKEEIDFHPTSVSVCMTAAEAKGQTYFKNRCLEDIANTPTIDAIPVAWLNQKYAENEPGEDKDYDYFIWDAIPYILTEWQNEQEAK